MSNLPKIDYPIYSITIPSTKQVFKFRPFLVKEEKILLISKESNNPIDILGAIKQIITNCAIDKNFDSNKLALFDLEYIFLKLRAFSVDNIIKVAYKDEEDQKVYDFQIDLNDVEVFFPEEIDNNVKITEKSGIVMKYPPATLYDDKEFLSVEREQMFELILRCIDKIYYEDEIYESKNYKKEELNEFLENLSMKVFEQIQTFLLNVPKLEHKFKYKNSLGNEKEIVLSSLNDFFSWR
jgi:hypothetical protein